MTLYTTFLSKKNFLLSASLVLCPMIHVSHSYYQSVIKFTKNFNYVPSADIRRVFLDILKAFDKVRHYGLVFKLQTYGIDGKLLNLLKSYLKDRQQRVLLNGQTSSRKNILVSVPQGSVLGPLLFLIQHFFFNCKVT